jgi:hypothetical protein
MNSLDSTTTCTSTTTIFQIIYLQILHAILHFPIGQVGPELLENKCTSIGSRWRRSHGLGKVVPQLALMFGRIVYLIQIDTLNFVDGRKTTRANHPAQIDLRKRQLGERVDRPCFVRRCGGLRRCSGRAIGTGR